MNASCFRPKAFDNNPEEEDEELQEKDGEDKDPKPQFLEAVAIQDYNSGDPKILSLTANARLTLYSKANSDWWTGNKINEDGDKVEGLIANNLIRILESDDGGSTIERIESANDDEGGVSRRHVSFNSNLQKWEEQCSNEKAPDLLQDVLDKSQEIEISNDDEDQKQYAFGTEV